MSTTSRRTLAAFVLLTGTVAAFAADHTPPALLGVEILDPTVNVVDGAAGPGVRLQIADGGTGLGRYSVHFQPAGYAQSLSGYDYSEIPRTSGSVTIRTEPLSLYHIDGPWELYNVTLCDRLDNCHQYVGDALDALLPSRTVTVVNARSPDGRPPSIKSGVVATPNVSLGGTDIRFRTRMTLADANSGATGASACFTSPSGNHSLCTYGTYSRPAKGTVEVQEGRITSPGTTETGIWTVTSAYVNDVVGNFRSITDPATIDALFSAGKTMTVTSAPAAAEAADTQAPTVVSLKVLAPDQINVALPPAAPTVRLEVSDDDTGLYEVFVGWQSPNHMQYRYTYDFSEAPKRSGTFDVMAPPLTMYDQPGTWEIYNVRVCDRATNCRAYEGVALDALTANRTVEVVNGRDPDAGLPSATAAELLTTSVSLAGKRTVRTRMTVDDDVSGVRTVVVCFTSPSAQSMCTNGTYSLAAEGTPQVQEGTLEATAETGAWTVTAVHVLDVPGNERIYAGAAQLDALFPAGHTLTVSP